MHQRRGSHVKGHYRNGSWIPPHYRRGTDVHDSEIDGIWVKLDLRTNRKAYESPCFICGVPVFYFRDENSGFAMFDELGRPWKVHSCWEELRGCEITRIKKAFKKALFEEKIIIREKNYNFKKINTDTVKEEQGLKWWHYILIIMGIKSLILLIMLAK